VNKSTSYIIVNKKCIPEKQAVIPAVTSGLYYGAGCFETFIADNGKIFKFDEHISRMSRGLDYLGTSENDKISIDLILRQIKTLLEKNQLTNKRCRIRIQASLNEKAGYSRAQDSSLILIITCAESAKHLNPETLIMSETSVVPSSARPVDLKLSNMLHYRQAYREAEAKGSDDALMLNTEGFIAETSIANIFWKSGNTIYTPSAECSILPGIMRNSFIDIIQNRLDLELIEGSYKIEKLLNADQVWITNSAVDFQPVSTLENKSYKVDNDLNSELDHHFQQYKVKHLTDVCAVQ